MEDKQEQLNPSGKDFCHLHMHTEHSLLDGINRVTSDHGSVAEEAKAMGCTSLAVTDHGTVSSFPSFTKECRRVGIRPILGMEAYYTVLDRSAKERDVDGERYYHLVVIAQNNNGLKNLIKLSSRAYTEGLYYKPRVDDALLADCAQDLMATSACLGSRWSKLILLNRTPEAEKLLLHHAAMFKDRFFVELQAHANEEQEAINKVLIKLADKHNLPLIMTSDAHYTHPAHKSVHEQTLCMQTNDVMTNPKRFSFGDIEVALGGYDYMAALAREANIPREALDNTIKVSQMVDDSTYFEDRYNKYPTYPLLEAGVRSWEELEYKAKQGLVNRFGGSPPQEYKDRLLYELKVTKQVAFSDYCLIIDYIVNYARDNLDVYVGPGRGSAGGSLIMWSLGVTQVDPVKNDLLFERFLNPGRAANPIHFTPEMKTLLS